MRITVKWRPPAPSSDISTKLYVSKDSGLPRTHFTVAHGAGWIQRFIHRQSQNEAHSLSHWVAIMTSYTMDQSNNYFYEGHMVVCAALDLP